MSTIQYLSTTELAKIKGISRVAILKQIKKGQIKAQKVGRNFVINKDDVPGLSSGVPVKIQANIDQAVKKTVAEYGEALRLLGKE